MSLSLTHSRRQKYIQIVKERKIVTGKSCSDFRLTTCVRTTGKWWSQAGSNRRPPACKAGALPAELWPPGLSFFRLRHFQFLSGRSCTRLYTPFLQETESVLDEKNPAPGCFRPCQPPKRTATSRSGSRFSCVVRSPARRIACYASDGDRATRGNLVGLGRFELPTSPLSGVRSNQLSYRPKS